MFDLRESIAIPELTSNDECLLDASIDKSLADLTEDDKVQPELSEQTGRELALESLLRAYDKENAPSVKKVRASKSPGSFLRKPVASTRQALKTSRVSMGRRISAVKPR